VESEKRFSTFCATMVALFDLEYNIVGFLMVKFTYGDDVSVEL
jgi:hypothetical protein